jgi:hypothetical protein
LASFIRALQLVLGSDSTGYVLNYVDDIGYSNIYEEHVKHLHTVLEKLRTAGFAINIDKCDFVGRCNLHHKITVIHMPVIHDMDIAYKQSKLLQTSLSTFITHI